MTTVTFTSEGSRIVALQVQGHSGYGEEGSDIICAAVSSVVSVLECAINDVLGLQASVKVDPRNTEISIKLPGKLPAQADSTCQTMLTATMLYLVSLHEAYPANITVLEV